MLQMGEPYAGLLASTILLYFKLLSAFCLFALLQLVNEKFAIRSSC